ILRRAKVQVDDVVALSSQERIETPQGVALEHVHAATELADLSGKASLEILVNGEVDAEALAIEMPGTGQKPGLNAADFEIPGEVEDADCHRCNFIVSMPTS